MHAAGGAAGHLGQFHGLFGLLAAAGEGQLDEGVDEVASVYPAFRIGVALVGLLFSVSWMLERATLTSADPFEGIQTWLVGHPLLVAASVAALAVVARRTAPRTPRATPEHSGAH
ncbi:hypothetical protein [Streptomyces avermitilis]|uniref:hypothetical protein n=1 Tax=Streptomyces avermitilis TaxID=33903 RepID=UPI0036BDE568